METAYNEFDNNRKPEQQRRILIGLLAVTCILLLVTSILAGIFGASSGSNSSSGSIGSTNTTYCTTTACLELAADLAQSINTSVDPCDDFYHYVCDGWDDDNSWINIRYPQYGAFATLETNEKETFLDELFYKTKPELVGYTSVQKAQTFFATCHESAPDTEDVLQSEFLQQLLNATQFAVDETWTEAVSTAFQQTMAYLTKIDFNVLFTLQPQGLKLPFFTQFFGLWSIYEEYNATNTIQTVFVPLYQELLDLDAADSKAAGQAVAEFAAKVYEISTVNDPDYQDYSTLIAMLAVGNFSDLNTEFGGSDILDYQQLVSDVYGVSPNDPELLNFIYFSKGQSFFKNLTRVLAAEKPETVQLFIWTSILYYYLDFQESYTQDQFNDRTDFCYKRTVDHFPFVYGYILFNKLYSDDTYLIASSLANAIKYDGTKVLIEESTWLDEESKAAALKKVNDMQLYIGSPPKIKNGSNVDEYYKNAEQSIELDWLSNLELLTQFDFATSNGTFWGKTYSLTEGWPDELADDGSFDAWLTGVNAFYVPTGNWFIIPVTISQPPFLVSDMEYPSALTYGGLGVVTGHEMSHGFDPSGSQFNYNGTFVGSIFTNYSREIYEEKIQCFKDQYDQIVVDVTTNGKLIYDDGNKTITENVADNAGMASSWTAWRTHIDENGDDKSIFGVDLSQEQLFFIGYARVWCETDRPGSYANWTDVHSPNYARVIGAVQNSPHFADAFGCKSDAKMNPSTKCTIW